MPINSTENNIKTNSALKGTVKAGAIGAGVGAVVNGGTFYLAQKSLLNNKDVFNSTINTINEVYQNTPFEKAIKQSTNLMSDFIKNGKLDYKTIGRAAASGAIKTAGLFAGVYIGVKALKATITALKNKITSNKE